MLSCRSSLSSRFDAACADRAKTGLSFGRNVTGESYPREIARATTGADLLVIGHCHRNSFLAAFMDSIDERIPNLVNCPVLIVPRSKTKRRSYGFVAGGVVAE